jgi:phosphate transport system substrate-binding protein
MASRPINSEEQDLCATNGREPLPFIIGNDALTVLVHTGNDAVSDATLDELAQLFGSATTWVDVNPDWPSEDIMRVVPAEETDSFTVFADAVFGGDAQTLASAASTEMQAEPSAILEGVEAEETAAGFLSYTHYVLEQDRVKLVMVEGMEPETGNVASGEYPLSSPMILYTSESLMQEKPQVAGFINYALLTVNSVIVDQGYFPVTEADMEQSKQYWFEANPQ